MLEAIRVESPVFPNLPENRGFASARFIERVIVITKNWKLLWLESMIEAIGVESSTFSLWSTQLPRVESCLSHFPLLLPLPSVLQIDFASGPIDTANSNRVYWIVFNKIVAGKSNELNPNRIANDQATRYSFRCLGQGVMHTPKLDSAKCIRYFVLFCIVLGQVLKREPAIKLSCFDIIRRTVGS